MTIRTGMEPLRDIDAVLFDFSDVVGQARMALAGEPGEGPYRIELIKPVVDAIALLRQAGIKVGLVTNNDRDAFFHHAPDLDLDSIFDLVVFSSDVGVSKPNFGIYTYALKQLGADAHRTVFLDDVARNVDAAEALGMTGVVIDQPETAIAAVNAVLAGR